MPSRHVPFDRSQVVEGHIDSVDLNPRAQRRRVGEVVERAGGTSMSVAADLAVRAIGCAGSRCWNGGSTCGPSTSRYRDLRLVDGFGYQLAAVPLIAAGDTCRSPVNEPQSGSRLELSGTRTLFGASPPTYHQPRCCVGYHQRTGPLAQLAEQRTFNPRVPHYGAWACGSPNLGRFGVGSGNPFDLIRRMVAPPVGCRAEHRNQRANACQLSAADSWLPSSLSQLLTEAAAQRCESGWGYGSSPPSDLNPHS